MSVFSKGETYPAFLEKEDEKDTKKQEKKKTKTKKDTSTIKNIVAIDFDFIMSPCIRLYDQYCNDTENASVVWEIIKQNIGDIETNLKYDANSLLLLDDIIRACKVKSIIKTPNQNEAIKKILDGESNKNVKYVVYNIDFHHDIIYNKDECAKLKYFDEYNSSNWIGYLHYKDKLKEYHWCKTINSTAPNMDGIKKADEKLFNKIWIHPYRSIEEDLLENLKCGDLKVDYLAVCSSPQWVPYQYNHLYELLTREVI